MYFQVFPYVLTALFGLFTVFPMGLSSSSKSKAVPTPPTFSHYYGHLECPIAVDDFNSGSVDTAKVCREAEYFVNVKKLLSSTPDTRENDWLTNILNSLVTMYDDLKFARSPAIIHLGGHHLNATSKAVIHPISACIPEERVLTARQNKTRPIGLFTYHQHLTHGAHVSSLMVDHDEDIEKSYFVLAQLQVQGWDAPYNVQILSRGSLPLHLNLRHCPHSAMTAHPKQVYKNILKIPGLSVSYNKLNATQNSHHMMVRCDVKSIPMVAYDLIDQALLRYTHNVLTTSAMASYVLETVLDEDIHSGNPIKNITSSSSATSSTSKGSRRLSWFGGSSSSSKKSNDKKKKGSPSTTTPANTAVSAAVSVDNAVPRLSVLYLTHHPHDAFQDDFLTDLLLHGLIRVLGAGSVTDYPKRKNLYYDSSVVNNAAPKSGVVNKTSEAAAAIAAINAGRTLNRTAKHDWDLKILDAKNSARDITSDGIKAAIESHKFDLVIIASDHHRDEFDQHHPTHSGKAVPVDVSTVEHFGEVCQHYKPSEVVYVDGAEHHLTRKLLERYAGCVGHFFSREGFVEAS